MCDVFINQTFNFIPECFKQTNKRTTVSTMAMAMTMTKPSVRFVDNPTQEILTTGVIDLFHDQQTTLWYSQSDYERFRAETPHNFIEPNPCRQRLVKSILSQQWEHQKLGMSDPKGLQKLSRACSKGARQRASALAIANSCDVNGTVPVASYSAPRRSPTRHSPRKISSSVVAPILDERCSSDPRRTLPTAFSLSAVSA